MSDNANIFKKNYFKMVFEINFNKFLFDYIYIYISFNIK